MVNYFNIKALKNLDLFFHVFNNMSDMVFLTEVVNNTEFRYLVANEPAKNFVGITDQSFGKPLHEVLPTEAFQLIESKYLEVMVKREPILYEEKMAVPASVATGENYKYSIGQIVYWESTITPFFNDSGLCTHLLAVVRDITDRKMKEKELIRVKNRLELIWNSAADAMFTFDIHEKFVSVNKAFENLLGWTEADILADPSISIISTDSKEEFKGIMEKLKKGDAVPSHEIQCIDKVGKKIDILASYSPFNDQEDQWSGAVVVYKDITERKRYEEKLKHVAHHDYLTCQPNRALFSKRLEEEWKLAKQSQSTLAILLLDLDNFKQINDTMGHDIGDELLKGFAQRINNCLPENGMLARLGGDEFAILLPELKDKSKAMEVANRILHSSQDEWHFNNHKFKTTISMGISFYPPYEHEPNTLLKNADIALYQAKEKGRNNYQVSERT